MARETIESHTDKSGKIGIVLLTMCLLIMACTTTLPQRLAGMTNAVNYSFSEILYGNISAGLLIAAPLSYVLWNMSRRKDGWYRLTGMETGFVVLVVAGAIGIVIASDKRAAVNHIVFLLTAILMGILLVQVVDTSARIKVVLYTIMALGIINTYECASQYYESNDVMVQEYERNPDQMLAEIGIQKGTYEQMMFEYHLKSKDVRGYFTTSNSAGSFMLLAIFAAIAIVVEGCGSYKTGRTTSGEMLGKCIVLAALFWGLWLTQSKGAIGAGAAALVLLGIWRISRSWLWKHRYAAGMLAAILIIAGITLVIGYGLKHGTLPGGKSMFVRWQYWSGAARMYAEHPLGIGGGNFYAYYPQYKIPAAPETVKDPHNFLLSMLTQYGPLGLIGLLCAMLVPLASSVFGFSRLAPGEPSDKSFSRLSIRVLIAVCLGMLAIRPLVMSFQVGTALGVALFVIAMLFVLPLFLMAGTFLLTSTREDAGPFTATTKAVLVCGLLGVMLHNCVDFAIFEPGVLMPFWAIMATLVAIEFVASRPVNHIRLRGGTRAIAVILAGLAIVAFVLYVAVPTSKAEFYLERANSAIEISDVATAHIMYDAAALADPLTPEPCYENGRLCLFEYQNANPDPNVLKNAERWLTLAIARDPEYYKYYGKLSEVYATAAQTSVNSERLSYLKMAYASGQEAIARYPGEASIHISQGDIADELGKRQEAVDEYKRAIAIEDSYRRMFAEMYPDRQLYSRLGEEKYQYARSRVIELERKAD
jgi:hypothetical protein